MQHTRARRALTALFAALIVVLVGVTMGSAPASAQAGDRGGHHHQQGHCKQGRHDNGDRHAKSDKPGKAHNKQQESKQTASGLGDLDELLNSIFHQRVPKLVNQTVPKTVKSVVTSTQKTTTQAVDTTTGLVTDLTGSGAGPAAPPQPAPTHARPTHPAVPTQSSAHPARTQGSASPAALAAGGRAAGPGASAAVHPAPLNGPDLVATTARTATHPAPKAAAHRYLDALTPASLLTAPGAGILIGAVIVFGLGVFVVVYGAGYRGRRIH
ncbi:MAG: hypothetical protein ACRDU4_04035 [Mycobacterium sp.]